jgi:hypothetical protein
MNPSELRTAAERVVNKLKFERERGSIMPDRPVTGTVLMEAYNRRFGTNWDDRHAREVIHYARTVLHAPIGYKCARGHSGYFYCLTEKEYAETKAKLRNRAMKILEAAVGGEKIFKIENQEELQLG